MQTLLAFFFLSTLIISLPSNAEVFPSKLFEANDFLGDLAESFEPYFYQFHQNILFDYKTSTEDKECATFYQKNFQLDACLYTEVLGSHLSQRLELLSKGKKKISITLEIDQQESSPQKITLFEMLQFKFPAISKETLRYRLHFSDFEMLMNYEKNVEEIRFELYTTPQSFTVTAHAFYQQILVAKDKYKRLYRSAYDLQGGLVIPRAQVIATKVEADLYQYDFQLEDSAEVTYAEFRQIIERGFNDNFAYLFESYLLYLNLVHQWPIYE